MKFKQAKNLPLPRIRTSYLLGREWNISGRDKLGESEDRSGLLMAMDLNVPRDNDPTMRIGTDFTRGWSEGLSTSIRGSGYQVGKSGQGQFGSFGFSAGFGITYKVFSFDFAWTPAKDLGTTYRYSVRMRFLMIQVKSGMLKVESNSKFRISVFLILLSTFHFLLSTAVEARQAILAQYTGTVEVQAKGTNLWRKATPKMVLNQYERIRTLRNSKATLLFDDGSRTMMSPGTTLMLEQLISPVNIQQSEGRTRNKVNKLGKGFALRTPTAVCSVRGTEFDVGVDQNGVTNLDVFEGVVNGQKTATGEAVDVKPGQTLTFTADSNPLGPPKAMETPQQESSLKNQAKKEVGLDMTRELAEPPACPNIRRQIHHRRERTAYGWKKRPRKPKASLP